MFKQLRWQNTKIGGKYFYVFLVVAVTFLLSIAITYWLLNQTSNTMKNTLVKSEIALQSSELVSLYYEKYNQIPEYILLSDDEHLNKYLEGSLKFVAIAKELKPQLSKEQLEIFNQIIENNNKLDEYFFSTIVPNVKQINTNEFDQLQKEAYALKMNTNELGNKLKNLATESNRESLTDAQNNIERTIILLVSSGIISLLISFALFIFITKKIEAGLKKVVDTSEEIAKGHLDFTPLEISGEDEIGQLSQSINNMGNRLREMILEVSHIASDVDHQSTTFAQTSMELQQGSSQVATTIEELATGVGSQANDISDISENMREFSERLVEVNQDGQTLVTFSEDVLQVSVNGDAQMKQSLQQMNVIQSVVENSVEKIKNLELKSQSITEVVTVIKSIAEQTNLLALNASIEAARAGESGKGFAVVASEVKKLANEVSHSVENISTIVTSIKQETAIISQELDTGFKQVNEGTEQIQLTGQYFSEIKEKVTDMTHRVKNISTIFTQFEKSSQDINNSVENIASISEQSAAGSQEISAAVHEQSQSIENINTSANTLSEMVERMNQLISRFKV
ncbi:methyl-accepting chemotaxis protein [Metabacillus crassostreae]|uniref:methyl-accepting chemotaxis protein n=1 Tax=Metabacillus crassostreae TaxID=929098 RepID=UPI00195D48B0|nr:HAMP domain-containing methyl-accepting chemotaxis protein [Metabacillus crassostreae]MBM7604870.1 methyl-accepting chemotaxis protein [Metabacillus crassostreae]